MTIPQNLFAWCGGVLPAVGCGVGVGGEVVGCPDLDQSAGKSLSTPHNLEAPNACSLALGCGVGVGGGV